MNVLLLTLHLLRIEQVYLTSYYQEAAYSAFIHIVCPAPPTHKGCPEYKTFYMLQRFKSVN